MTIHKLYLYTRFWDPNQLELLPVGPPLPDETVKFNIFDDDSGEVYVSSDLERILLDEDDRGRTVPFHFVDGTLETDINFSRKLYAEYRFLGYRKTLHSA